MSKDTEQLGFWRGKFGNAYIGRNTSEASYLKSCTAMWAPIMAHLDTTPPRSILEIGSNIGNNLRALREFTDAEFFAVEPNAKARDILIRDGVVSRENALDGFAASIGLPDRSVDMVFTCGVLIHIHPNDLEDSCREIYRVARRHIVCIEYFSDRPEEIPYHGQTERLFKRDFGGYWLDLFPNMETVNYGFVWKRANGPDNLNWWLFAK